MTRRLQRAFLVTFACAALGACSAPENPTYFNPYTGGTGATGTGGVGGTTCPAGQLLCGTVCVPSDGNNCGVCGNVCGVGQNCLNNTCQCQAPYTSCRDRKSVV